LSRYADGLFFLSLISGRNPQFLIEEQVRAAPIIKRMGLEPVPTGYILIGGGDETAVTFASGTRPVPAALTEIAVAHALAAQYLGMKLLYLESGSGASNSVPEKIISAVKEHCTLPVVVGGGITTPELAAAKVRAGADFIVIGNVLEVPENTRLIKNFAEAIHSAV
jgi:phosphoglycerol geranylgeranyltransferase